MTGEIGWVGYQPIVEVGPDPEFERKKYEAVWRHEQYRQVAPGEQIAPLFIAHARPKPGSTVIDFGSGTGRGALMLAVLSGVKVHMLDFAANCLDDDVRQMIETQPQALSFTQHDLTQPVPFTAAYGFCTDVMEHIPTSDVDKVLTNIVHAAQHCFFQIALEDDKLGALIGAPLHLTVQPYAWWLDKFRSLGCAITWSEDCGSHALFYVTAWKDSKDLLGPGELNTEEQQCVENVRQNLKGGWNQVVPHVTNDLEAMIVGGGPSLQGQLDEIKRLRSEGVKLITLNGAYNWCLEHGLTPSAQIIVDARPFNARFTRPVVDSCVYLICSQCDPGVLEGLPKERTYLWHTSSDMFKAALDEHYQSEPWFGVPGGTTVLLRGIPLMRMLGYTKFHLFGCDSCLEEGRHHAFSQPENDSEAVLPLSVGGRTFMVHPWMAMQANEFIELVRHMADDVQLEIHGDGLLAHILRTGAELNTEAE